MGVDVMARNQSIIATIFVILIALTMLFVGCSDIEPVEVTYAEMTLSSSVGTSMSTTTPPVSSTTTNTTTTTTAKVVDIPYKPNIDEDKKVLISNPTKIITESDVAQINKYLSEYEPNTAIYVKNLNDGMTITFNEDEYLYAASLIKLPFSYYAFNEIESKNHSLEEKEIYEEKYVTPGTGILLKEEIGGKYSLKELLYLNIQCSDNAAYRMINDHFGYEGYNKMLSADGFKSNLTKYRQWGDVSAKLMGHYWEEIYHNYNKSELWEEFYRSLFNTTYSPIKNTLGSSVRVANKTGWADASYHESGIVFRENCPYVITIMTVSEGEKVDKDYMMHIIKEIDRFIVKYNT